MMENEVVEMLEKDKGGKYLDRELEMRLLGKLIDTVSAQNKILAQIEKNLRARR